MRFLISGAGGLIGSALGARLTAAGHAVVPLVREGSRPPAGGHVWWDPERGTIDARGVEGFDAVVHLAAENLAARRWSAAQKRRIERSRVLGTQTLVTALVAAERPPATLVSASAIGWYGDRGEEEVDETSGPGTGFLARVCHEWEAAALAAAKADVRVVLLRSGVVLSRRGGALQKLLVPFRLGLGGRLGSGRQWFSWISLEDEVAAIEHLLLHAQLAGPFDLVAPEPVRNAEFARTLARVLRRPAVLPVPAFVLRLVVGELAPAALLASARVRPRRLLDGGFSFRLPRLEDALRAELGR
jgi:uncharacterized protein (TIGR01777 family)